MVFLEKIVLLSASLPHENTLPFYSVAGELCLLTAGATSPTVPKVSLVK